MDFHPCAREVTDAHAVLLLLFWESLREMVAIQMRMLG